MKYFIIKTFSKGTFLFSDLNYESLGIKRWDTLILKSLISMICSVNLIYRRGRTDPKKNQ